jgi:hypothetical protein
MEIAEVSVGRVELVLQSLVFDFLTLPLRQVEQGGPRRQENSFR